MLMAFSVSGQQIGALITPSGGSRRPLSCVNESRDLWGKGGGNNNQVRKTGRNKKECPERCLKIPLAL